jgi:hypothetical protein
LSMFAKRRAVEAVPQPVPGVYIQFQAPAGVDLKLESLQNKEAGIELPGVQRTTLHKISRSLRLPPFSFQRVGSPTS